MNALELADALEAQPECTCHAMCYFECGCDAIWPEQWIQQAAAELRRLHAENQRCRDVCAATAEGWRQDRDALLEALKAELDQRHLYQPVLTDEIIADLWYQNGTYYHHFARAIERYLTRK